MIKLKDNSKEQCEKLRDLFMTMKGRVPQALDVEAGADFLHSERSFDVCLTVTLESPEALEEYQKDPYHCNTVKTYVATVAKGGCGRLHRLIEQNSRGTVRLLPWRCFFTRLVAEAEIAPN